MRQALKILCAGACFLPVSAQSAAPARAPAATLDTNAVAALDKMAVYLRTLNSFELKADTLTDNVLENGQSVQFGGTVDYKVRRPNGFVITVADDRKIRQFSYDGKSFTIFSPRMGYYATVSAPATIHELLDNAYQKYGIELPMADLFRWGEPGDRHDDLKSGFLVGYARINNQDADQYAFRSGDIDWQIWIARGDKPVPLKAVITDTSDPARPEYAAVFHWTPGASFTDTTFAFKPPAGGKPIKLAQQQE